MLTKAQIDDVFAILSKDNPDPKTELNFVNHYTLLVAVILSAQATDKGVNKATKTLFEQVQSPQSMLDLGEDGLKDYIKTIGLYNAKAKNVIAMSRILVDQYDGQVPNQLKDLQALPGVGRKTANVVLNEAFGVPTIAVDTHIFRVSQRLGLAKGKTPDAIESILVKKIPDKWKLKAHHWLILHGRYICKARKPICVDCDILHLCQFKDKTV